MEAYLEAQLTRARLTPFARDRMAVGCTALCNPRTRQFLDRAGLTVDDALVHQVHPVKLCTDIAAAAASTGLLWRRRLLAGLLIRYLPPMVASALVLACADLDRLRQTPAGRYALHHMPDGAVAIRFAGDAVMAAAAWRRSLPGIAAGVAVIAAGWSHGLLPRHTLGGPGSAASQPM